MGRPLGSPNKDKPFRDALRMEAALAELGQPCPSPRGSLRWNARQLLNLGEPTSIKEVRDTLDGRPAQESTVTLDDKRDATDWSTAELVALLNEFRANVGIIGASGEGQREPDLVYRSDLPSVPYIGPP